MSDLPKKTSQEVPADQRLSGSRPPRNAGRKPYRRGPRKNEITEGKATPNQPATPRAETPAGGIQQPPRAADPVATQPATPDPQPPKGAKAPRQPQPSQRGKSKTSGKRPARGQGAEAPSKDTPQSPPPSTPAVPTLSLEVPTTSAGPAESSRSSRPLGHKLRGRGGHTGPPGRKNNNGGKGRTAAYDEDVTKVTEDDTSSSYSSSVPTPTSSPSGFKFASNHHSSRSSTSKSSVQAPAGPSKPIVHEINLDIWNDNVDDASWSTPTPTNNPSGFESASNQRGSKYRLAPAASKSSVQAPVDPPKPIIHEIDLNDWADNVNDATWSTNAEDTPSHDNHPESARSDDAAPPSRPVPAYALPDRPPPPTPIMHEIDLNDWADNVNDAAWSTNAEDTPSYDNHPESARSDDAAPPSRPFPSHVLPDRTPPPTPPSQIALDQPPPIQPPIDDAPTSIRRVGLAHVLLGPGACVQHVFTDAESPWIMISNLPRGTRRYRIQALVAPFGETHYIKVYEPQSDTHYLPTARVLFDKHESAKSAVSMLQGQTMQGKRIIVRLDTDTSGARLSGGFVRGLAETGPANSEAGPQSSLIGHDPAAVLRSCTVKVTWCAPVASVYITYQSHRFATERVKELNGRSFGNRRVQMKPVYSERDDLARVGRENGGYVVRMDGLWSNLDLSVLGRFVRSQDLVVQPNYSSEAGLTKLRQDLSDVAPLESFKLLQTRREDKKYHALAQYTTPAAASAAVKIFEGRRGEYLGNSPIWVSRHLRVKYSIPAKLAAALQGELNRLHSWSMDDPDLHVNQKDEVYKHGYVQISISGNETKHIAAAKAQLDRALAGEPLLDADGEKAWDPYFLNEDWAAFSEGVAEQTGVCVRADQRTCSLLLFGPDYARDDAGALMRNELARLAQLKQVLKIPPPVFRRLRAGGLTILRNLVGKGNIYVNVFRQSLTFYGDDEVVRRVKKAIDVMDSEVGARLPRHSDCVVCLCQPEQSILLHCGHNYCRSCFSQYVASAAENRTLPVVCVGSDCKAPIPLSMITLHASQPDQDALFYAAFQSHVAAHPEQYRYCPTPDCQYVYRVGQPDTSVQCRLCLTHICTHCHVEHHEGISCEDYLASHSESEIQKSFDRWRASHDVKSCPNCNANIEKIAGCNHMMCAVCRTHICWVCMSSFTTGDGVYAHMRKAHGGIGL
ncbi:hypothetical protein FRC10_008258 [Ceratobasidium sp. 414]|nr:hypothetical protein FRC10_008258 [Ceratobasidium sp. 414]